jgi:hypothetical protein
MRYRFLVSLLLVPTISFAGDVRLQVPNPLVGSWERFAVTDAGGRVRQAAPPAFVVFTPDGFFSETEMQRGRPLVDEPLEAMTTEELLARFASLVAARGTYTVSGNTVTRTYVAHSNPEWEGEVDVRVFRIAGDTLIITDLPPDKSRFEARYRHAT